MTMDDEFTDPATEGVSNMTSSSHDCVFAPSPKD